MFAVTPAEVAVLLVVLGAPVAALGALILSARRRTATSGPTGAETAVAARRHAAVVSALAWSVALLTPPLLLVPTARWALDTTRADSLTAGVLTGLAPASAGLLFLGVHLVGERSWPRPTGTLRRAALVRRTPRDIVPGWLRTVVLVWTALLGATLVTCGIVSIDGRSVTRTWPGGASTAGPFPGWFYGLPLLAATLAVLAGTVGVLRLVAGRPAVEDAQPAWDLSLRRLSAHRVLRGVQLVIGATTSGVLAVASSAVLSISRAGTANPATSSTLAATIGVALAILAAVVGVASIVIALIPGQPASAPLGLTGTAGRSGTEEPDGTDLVGRAPHGDPAGRLP